jgi:hypothetical protein
MQFDFALVYYLIIALLAEGVTAWDICEDNSDNDEAALSLLQHDLYHETSGSSSTSSNSRHHSLTTASAASRYSESANSLTMLPSIDCVRMITLNDSERPALLMDELKVRGLWNRTTVQIEQLDPEGGTAGCFRSHVRAWNFGLTQECANLLVLEDDAFFENDTVHISSSRAESFLRSGRAYDTLYLGWDGCYGPLWPDINVSQIDGANCAFQLVGKFCTTHAYVISKTAMQKFSTMEYKGVPIDVELSRRNDSISSTVRPMFAFQRMHESSIPWSKVIHVPNSDGSPSNVMDKVQDYYGPLQAQPDFVHENIESLVYEASAYGDVCAS